MDECKHTRIETSHECTRCHRISDRFAEPRITPQMIVRLAGVIDRQFRGVWPQGFRHRIATWAARENARAAKGGR